MKPILKYTLIILGCVFLVNLSCEDVDLEGEDAGNVQGFWELNQASGSNTFLLVSPDEVIFYFYDANENCIKLDAYQVVRIDGTGFYILTKEGLEENRVLAISKNGDRIHVRDINETQSNLDKFWPSEVDINTLAPFCVNETDVFGEWELIKEDDPPVYLSISEDSIRVIVLVPEQECFFISVLEVLEINGIVFTLTDNSPNSTSGTQEVKIIRTKEGVEIERNEDGEIIKEIYTQSEADFSKFKPVCEFQ